MLADTRIMGEGAYLYSNQLFQLLVFEDLLLFRYPLLVRSLTSRRCS